MKMRPKLILKTRKTGLCEAHVSETMKNLIVHIDLLPLLLTKSRRETHGSATAVLCIFHDHRRNDEPFETLNRNAPNGAAQRHGSKAKRRLPLEENETTEKRQKWLLEIGSVLFFSLWLFSCFLNRLI
jgi:hypothetical protein